MKKDNTTKHSHKEDPKGKRKLEFCTKSKLSSVKLPLTGKTLYLDVKDSRSRRRLEEDLKKLGATVEEFLSKDLNYLITSQPRPKDKDDSLHGPDSPAAVNTPSPFSCGASPSLTSAEPQKVAIVPRGRAIAERARLKASVSSVVQNAEKWGVKIVSMEAAVKWIEKELKKLPKEESAKHTSAKENQRHRHGLKIKKLQSPFLKFEAVNHCYRPCHSQLEAWPRVNTDTRRGTCPFDGAGLAQDEPSREERGELIEAAQLDALTFASPKEEQEGSCQSGPHPGASNKMSEEAAIQFGGGRLITSGELRRRKEQKRRQERKRGYCECCNIKYEDLDKHVQEQQHWSFARDKQNFTSLDTLILSAPSTAEFLQKVLMGHILQKNVTRQPESTEEAVDLIVENEEGADKEKRNSGKSSRSVEAEGNQPRQSVKSPRLEKTRQKPEKAKIFPSSSARHQQSGNWTLKSTSNMVSNSALVTVTVEEKASLPIAFDSNRIDGREGNVVHEQKAETLSPTEGRKSKRLANSGVCGTVEEAFMELKKGPYVSAETGSNSKVDADKVITNELSVKMKNKELSVIENLSSANKPSPENDSKSICITIKDDSNKMSPKVTNTVLSSVKPPVCERQSKITAKLRLLQSHFQDEEEIDQELTFAQFSRKALPKSNTDILPKENDTHSSSFTPSSSRKTRLVAMSNIRNDSRKMSEDLEEKCSDDKHQTIHYENKENFDKKNSEKDNLHTKDHAAKSNRCYAINKKNYEQEVVNNMTKEPENGEHQCEMTKNEEESKYKTRLWSLTGQKDGQIETCMADEKIDTRVSLLQYQTKMNSNQCDEEPFVTQKCSRRRNNTLHQDRSNTKDEDNMKNDNYKNVLPERTVRETRLVQKNKDSDMTLEVTGNVVECREIVNDQVKNIKSPGRLGKHKGKDILKNNNDEIHDHEADVTANGISGHQGHQKEHTKTRTLRGRDWKVDVNKDKMIVDGKIEADITKVIEEIYDEGPEKLDQLGVDVFISRKKTKSKDKFKLSKSEKNTKKQNGKTSFDRNIAASQEFVQKSGTEPSLDGQTQFARNTRSQKKDEGLARNKDSEIQMTKPIDSSGVKSLANDGNKLEVGNKSVRCDSATLVLRKKIEFIDFKISNSHFNDEDTTDTSKEIPNKLEGLPEMLIFRQSIAELAKLRRQNRGSVLQNGEAKDDMISQVNNFIVSDVSLDSQNLKKMLSPHSKCLGIHRSQSQNPKPTKRTRLHSGRDSMCTANGIDKIQLSATKGDAIVLETDMWNSRSLSSVKSSTDSVIKIMKKDVANKKCTISTLRKKSVECNLKTQRSSKASIQQCVSTPRKRKLDESDAVSTKVPKMLDENVHGPSNRVRAQSFSEVTEKTCQEDRSPSPVFNKSPKLRRITETRKPNVNDLYDTKNISEAVIHRVQTDLCDSPQLRRPRSASERFTAVKTQENDSYVKEIPERSTACSSQQKGDCPIPDKVWTPRKSRKDEDIMSSPKSGFSNTPMIESRRGRYGLKEDHGQRVLSSGKSQSLPRSKKDLSKSFSERKDESEMEVRRAISRSNNCADNSKSEAGNTGSQKSVKKKKRRTCKKGPDTKEQKSDTQCFSDRCIENLSQQISKKRKLDKFKFEIQGDKEKEGIQSAKNSGRIPQKIEQRDSNQGKCTVVQGNESLLSRQKSSETIVNCKTISQQSCHENSSGLVALGKRGLNENVPNKINTYCASAVTNASVSNNHSKTMEKDNSQNVSFRDEERKLTLKWSPAGVNTTSNGKKKVKLKRHWSLLSKRSAQAIFIDEDDRSSFTGFTEGEVSANSGLPSDLSFENCSEVSFDEKSDEEWVIDDEEKLETQKDVGNVLDFGQFLPPTFSSPGKRSDSSWDDACEDYLNKSIKHVTPLGKFWLKSPHKSPARLDSRLLVSVPANGSEPESAILQTPRKDRNRKSRNTLKEVPSIEKIDDDIEFNYLSPQKLQSNFSPLQGKIFGGNNSPERVVHREIVDDLFTRPRKGQIEMDKHDFVESSSPFKGYNASTPHSKTCRKPSFSLETEIEQPFNPVKVAHRSSPSESGKTSTKSQVWRDSSKRTEARKYQVEKGLFDIKTKIIATTENY